MEKLDVDRYFVVLKAYDFRTAWKERRRKLLWEPRFSIRAQGARFDQQLAGMAQTAAAYFGEASGRLIRRPLPEGRVDKGEPTTIRVEP
ncbi:MAG TPA: hypothetical protein VEQ65_02410 [Opitutus sp.]|nr:hypothetical protein [Opitutus sp.]